MPLDRRHAIVGGVGERRVFLPLLKQRVDCVERRSLRRRRIRRRHNREALTIGEALAVAVLIERGGGRTSARHGAGGEERRVKGSGTGCEESGEQRLWR